MAFGVVNEPFYKKMNPNSRVPTIDDDGFVLWESNAIVRYLAAKHGAGTLWPTGSRERAGSGPLESDWTSDALDARHDAGFLGARPLAGRPAFSYGADRGRRRKQPHSSCRLLEQGLEGRDYVAGKNFTMGDIVVGAQETVASAKCALDVKRLRLARIEAYHERLKQRPAFQKHIMKPLT